MSLALDQIINSPDWERYEILNLQTTYPHARIYLYTYEYVYLCIYIYISIHTPTHIYIYESGPRTPTPPPMVWSPMVGGGPASYLLGFWQHFWPPASYWLGFCSISDYQPRICLVFAACRTTGIIFTRRMVPLSRPTSGLRSTHTASKYIRANLAMHTNTYIYIHIYVYMHTHICHIFLYMLLM